MKLGIIIPVFAIGFKFTTTGGSKSTEIYVIPLKIKWRHKLKPYVSMYVI